MLNSMWPVDGLIQVRNGSYEIRIYNTTYSFEQKPYINGEGTVHVYAAW